MILKCTECGARDARICQPANLVEHLKTWFGTVQLRCHRCPNRWETSVWANGAWRYARCPRCYRQELTTWNRHDYRPPCWTLIKLRLGAAPHRCAPCRCNFASFKRCKEPFVWRHATRIPATQKAKSAAATSGVDDAGGNGTSQEFNHEFRDNR
jgi:hypothetical protein